MRQAAAERRIRELQRRVRQAREELAILDEQIEALAEESEEARVRWLVAETPLAEKEATDARRHLELAQRAAAQLRAEIAQCVTERDRLLHELPVATGK
jgi:predicted  nucleic acid-binding Zn-ribbon protein